MDGQEKVIMGLECVLDALVQDEHAFAENGIVMSSWQDRAKRIDAIREAIALLKAQEPVSPNGEQYQCNKCKFYQGVHNVMGHAPCSFWNIGGVMWDDYCSHFSKFTDMKWRVNDG